MVQTRSASMGMTPARSRSSISPPPTATKRATRSHKAAATPSPTTPTSPTSPSATTAGWAHVPSTLTLVWLAVSLPLVAWDTGYVLLRPLSMPGGNLHWPLWAPYALYGEVDHMYGFKQWHAGNGFTAAQGALNLVETLMYVAYLWIWRSAGQPQQGKQGGGRMAVSGRAGGLAVVIAFSAAVMTVSKTVLYWLNEYFSAFDNIGHNNLFDLTLLWIIPNGAWLVFPSIMIYSLGEELVSAAALASAYAPAPARSSVKGE